MYSEGLKTICARKQQKITERVEGMNKKILIVEDNNDSLEILGLRVTNFGYEAIKARNSKEAIACVEAEPPDLIFMDIDLPDVDGVKTTAILKQNPKTSHIPVVALTAWMSELWREKALKVGIVGYLLKPVTPQTLRQTIEQFTNRSFNPTDNRFLKFSSDYRIDNSRR
jgi:two-component system, cell cycle response regulator DivK